MLCGRIRTGFIRGRSLSRGERLLLSLHGRLPKGNSVHRRSLQVTLNLSMTVTVTLRYMCVMGL